MHPVLMIITSHAQLGNSGQPSHGASGIWAEELTTPYYALVDAGFDVTLASPLGGTPPFVADSFNAGKPTAAVCHGPAGMARALRTNGKSFLFGKKVNGFTNAEETATGLMDVVPFSPRDKDARAGRRV